MTVPDAAGSASLLAWLFDQGHIALERAPLLDQPPPPITTPDRWTRVEGMLLALAVGDSLGNSSEAMAPADRWAMHGEIRDFLPNPYLGARRVGTPSDDTQLAFWTLEELVERGHLDPERLANRFSASRIFGIGRTVREFVRNFKDEGSPWWAAGPESAGNGALMRIAPVLVPHVEKPTPALWADAAIAGMLTHNDRASTASCVAFVGLLWDLLRRDAGPPPAAAWWLDTFVARLRPLEGRTHYASRSPDPRYSGWTGSLADFLDEHVRRALAEGRSARAACDGWHSGAYLLETVPSALYILCRHGHDPEEAIVRAANDTWDNDTVAAIVGAAVGELHGVEALPQRWRDGLLGRTRADDDGRVFELIAAARRRFALPGS
jgi:ADP-ribosyl-[dinitrogen reductase] hydrolase